MTPAVTLLQQRHIRHVLHPYTSAVTDGGWGLEAAAALGIPAERIFKTLIVAPADSRLLAVGIVPVSGSLDLKAMARAVGARKASMADARAAERATGYVLGGVSPIAQKRRLPTRLDVSAARFDTIYVSGGRRGLDIELAPADLLAVTGGEYASIAAP